MPLDRKAVNLALDVTEDLSGIRIEGNNFKITQLYMLREHLQNALIELDQAKEEIRELSERTDYDY